MTGAFITGFALGFSLILAIGAQNAFVLRQGIMRRHVFPVILVCALSDALLITAGVYGFGQIATAIPNFKPVLTWGGALFLFVYGALSFRSAWTGNSGLKADGKDTSGLWQTVLVCLALTWGNPHVYLDTLVLIGSIATKFSEYRLAFGTGAVLASFVFFFSLGYGARYLAPFFEKPGSWRILDVGVGALMWSIAFSLIWSL